jgi:Mor family transcriptional regulator
MTPVELQAVRGYRAFPDTAEDLIDVIGLTATAALIDCYGGKKYRVPVPSECLRDSHLERVRELEAMLGADAAQRLMANSGGDELYIPSCWQARQARKNELKKQDFDRLTRQDGISGRRAFCELSTKYGCSERSLETLVSNPMNLRKETQHG